MLVVKANRGNPVNVTLVCKAASISKRLHGPRPETLLLTQISELCEGKLRAIDAREARLEPLLCIYK